MRCSAHTTAPAREALDCSRCWQRRNAAPSASPEEPDHAAEERRAQRRMRERDGLALKRVTGSARDYGVTQWEAMEWAQWRRELRAYLDGEMPPVVQHEGGWRGSGAVREHDHQTHRDRWSLAALLHPRRDWLLLATGTTGPLGWLYVTRHDCERIPQDDTRHTLPLYDPQPEG